MFFAVLWIIQPRFKVLWKSITKPCWSFPYHTIPSQHGQEDKDHYFFNHPQLELWAPTVWNCWWLNFSRFSHYLQGWFAVPVHDSLSPSHVGHFHITLYHPNMIDKDKNHYFFSHPQLELWAPTVWNCWWLNFSRFSHYLQSSTVGTVGAHSLKLLMTKIFKVFSLLTRLVCCPSAW